MDSAAEGKRMGEERAGMKFGNNSLTKETTLQGGHANGDSYVPSICSE